VCLWHDNIGNNKIGQPGGDQLPTFQAISGLQYRIVVIEGLGYNLSDFGIVFYDKDNGAVRIAGFRSNDVGSTQRVRIRFRGSQNPRTIGSFRWIREVLSVNMQVTQRQRNCKTSVGRLIVAMVTLNGDFT